MNIGNFILVLMGLFFFIMGITHGQDFVNSDSFKNKIALKKEIPKEKISDFSGLNFP